MENYHRFFTYLILVFVLSFHNAYSLYGVVESGEYKLNLSEMYIAKYADKNYEGYKKIVEYSPFYKDFDSDDAQRCQDGYDNDFDGYADCFDIDCLELEDASGYYHCFECKEDSECDVGEEDAIGSCVNGRCVFAVSYAQDKSIVEDRFIGCGPCGKAVDVSGTITCEKDEEYLKNIAHLKELDSSVMQQLEYFGYTDDDLSCFDNYLTCELTDVNYFYNHKLNYYDIRVKDDCCIIPGESLGNDKFCNEFYKIQTLPCAGTNPELLKNPSDNLCYCGEDDFAFAHLTSDFSVDTLACGVSQDFQKITKEVLTQGGENLIWEYQLTDGKNNYFLIDPSKVDGNLELSFEMKCDASNPVSLSIYAFLDKFYKGLSPNTLGIFQSSIDFKVSESYSRYVIPLNIDEKLLDRQFAVSVLTNGMACQMRYVSLVSNSEKEFFKESRTLNYPKPKMEIEPTKTGMCPDGWCWTGTSCKASENYPWKAPSVVEVNGSGYKCINGEWKYLDKKYTPDYSEIGYCHDNSYCLITPHILSEDEMILSDDRLLYCNDQEGSFTCYDLENNEIDDLNCVQTGYTVGNYYCNGGEWISKTSLMASVLKNYVSSPNYVLHCDKNEYLLNNPNSNLKGEEGLAIFGKSYMSQDLCAMVYNLQDKASKTAIAINFNLNDQYYSYDAIVSDVVGSLLGEQGSSTCNFDSDLFSWKECFSNNKFKLLVNPNNKLMLLFITSQSSTLPAVFNMKDFLSDISKQIILEKLNAGSEGASFGADLISDDYNQYYVDKYFYSGAYSSGKDIEAVVVNKGIIESDVNPFMWGIKDEFSTLYFKYFNANGVNICGELNKYFSDGEVGICTGDTFKSEKENYDDIFNKLGPYFRKDAIVW